MAAVRRDGAEWLRRRTRTVDGDLLIAEAIRVKASWERDELGLCDFMPRALGRIPGGDANRTVVKADVGHSGA